MNASLRYVYFNSEQPAEAYRIAAKRLGWTCSTPWDHEDGRWSVCTNCPFSLIYKFTTLSGAPRYVSNRS
jgi:hypothetical protein